MIQKIKRPVSILLVLMMVVGMFTILPITASAGSPGDSGAGSSLDTGTTVTPGAATWTFKLNSNFSGEWNADTDVVSEQPIELNLAEGDYEFQIVAYEDGNLSSYRGNVQAGSFTENYSQIMYDNGGNAKFHADGGKYTLTYNAASGVATIAPVYVAQIDTANYKTLEAAIAAAQDDDTINLLSDCTVASQIDIEKNFYIDGNGHTITCTFADNYATNSSYANGAAFQLVGDDRIFSINNATLDGNGVGTVAINAYRSNNNAGNVINLEYVTVKNFIGYEHYGAIKLFSHAQLNADGCTFTGNTLTNNTQGYAGGADIWAGGAAVVYLADTNAQSVGLNGTSGGGADFALDQNSHVDSLNMSIDGYNNPCVLVSIIDEDSTICATSFKDTTTGEDARYVATQNGPTTNYTLFKTTAVAASAATYNADGNNAYYLGNDGKYYSDAAGTTELTYPDDIVLPMLTGAVAQVGDTKYGTFAEAVAAANGSLIKILAKDATPYEMSVGQTIVTDNYSKITIVAPEGAYAINRAYDSTAKTYTFTVIDAIASLTVGGTTTYYSSLNAAISAAPNSSATPAEVNLLRDSTELAINVGTATARKNVVIDLGGNTLTLTRNYAALFIIRNGSTAVVQNGKVVFNTVNANASGFVVQDNNSTLTLANTLDVEATGNTAGVYVKNGTLNSAADISAVNSFAICTNGSQTSNATINITGGTLTSDTVAVYLPGDANVTISGGDITGATAVYVKSGDLTISGGTFTATGAAADYTYNGNGANPTGDAIVVDSCGYPGGAPEVTITGAPTVTSANGKQIGDYSYGENDLGDVTAKSNTMTLSDGLEWVEDTEHPGTYNVGVVDYDLDFDKDSYTINCGSTSTVMVSGTKGGVALNRDGYTEVKNRWNLTFSGDEALETTKISSNGVAVSYTVKGLKVGTYTATLTDSLGLIAPITTTVTVRHYASPTLSGTTPRLVENGPYTFTALKFDGETVDLNDYTFTSLDENVATIDGTTITPLKEGSVPVKITSKSDPNATYTYNYTFTNAPAKIGDTYYQSLTKAMNAAADGDTVTLLKNTTESVVYSNADIEITLDLNGYTLTGASNTSYALRVEKGVITVKDSSEAGTGAVTYGKDYAFIVDHVANDTVRSKLVLESGTFTGKDTVAQVGMSGGSGSNKKYYGGDLEVVGGKFITVLDDGQTYDANGHFKYTLNKLDYNASSYPGGLFTPSTIVVKGGTFVNFDPSNNVAEGAATDFVDPDYKANFAEVGENGEYTVVAKDYVAQVGDDKFETFEAAVAARATNDDVITLLASYTGTYNMAPGKLVVDKNGFTFNKPTVTGAYIVGSTNSGTVYTFTTTEAAIEYTSPSGAVSYKSNIDYSNVGSSGTYKLLKDITCNSRIVPGMFASNVTFDLNGHTLTSTATDEAFLFSRAGSAASHNSYTITNGTIIAPGDGIQLLANYADLTLDGVTVNAAGDYGIVTNGTKTGNNITVTDSDITAEDAGIYKPSNGALTLTDTSVEGNVAVYVKSGTVAINGGTFTGTGAKADYTYNGSGINPTGDAIVIDSCGYPGGAPTVSIGGNPTITSTNGVEIGDYAGNGVTELAPVTATDNSLTLPEGLKWVETETEGVYKVAPDYVASVNGSGYMTFAEAVAARTSNNDVITLIKDAGTYTGDADEFPIKVAKDGKSVTVKVSGAYLITSATADGVTTYTVAEAAIEYTSPSGAVSYQSNIDYSNLGSSGTYKLLKDITAGSRIVPGTFASDVTVDLNGHTLTSNATDQAFRFSRNGSAASHKSFTITDTSTNGGGKIVANNLANSGTSNTSSVIGISGSYTDVTLTNITIEATQGIGLLGNNQSLTINNCDITVNGTDYALATNGSQTNGAVINVTDSSIESTGGIGVYLPGGATSTFTDTDVTGTTAMYIKSGNTTIEGGTYTATGDAAEFTHNGNGANATGDAIVVESCNYPNGVPTVSIGADSIVSANGVQVGDYTYGEQTADANVTATSNTLTLPEGLMWVETATPGVYEVGFELFPGYSVSVGGKITLNVYINTNAIPGFDQASNASVTFTWDSEEAEHDNQYGDDTYTVDLLELTPDANGYVRASVPVNAAQMANTITAEVTVDGTDLNETGSFSVKEYGETILADTTQTANVKTLVKAMLNYGAMAQTVFNSQLKVKPTVLANSGAGVAYTSDELNDVDSATIISAIEEANDGNRGATVEDLRDIGHRIGYDWTTTSVIFLEDNTIRHYFDDVYETRVKPAGEDVKVQDTYFYYVEKKDIASNDLDTLYTFSIGGETFEYSVLDYAAAILESPEMGVNAQNLAKALYLYNQAANACIG